MPRTTNPQLTARRVQRLSRALGLTLRELAPLFGVSYQSLRNWSCGRHAPGLKYQFRLAQLELLNEDRLVALDKAEAPIAQLLNHATQGATR